MRKSACVFALASAIFFLYGRASGSEENTDVLIDGALAMYAQVNFEASLKLLDRAFRNPGNSRAQLVRMYHLKGICHSSLGQYVPARESFARLLALEPSFRLGEDLAPRVKAPFEELLRRGNPPRLDAQLLPPPSAVEGKNLVLTARVASDTTKMARSFRFWFRRGGSGSYSSIRSELRGVGEHKVEIPAQSWEGKGEGAISWFATFEDENGGRIKKIGDELSPMVLEVAAPLKTKKAAGEAEETSWYERWWVWAIVGGVAAAGAAAAFLAYPQPSGGMFDVIVDIE